MEIIVGKTSGFCYGVKRAVDGCEEQIQNNKKVYCLGEIVHNKQVVTNLEQKGIKFIEDIEEIKDSNSKLIIRAHGVDKQQYVLAKNKHIEVIDYTCPNVLKIHKIAEQYKKDGYYIFLTGTENHPEVKGIISHCGDNYSIITVEEDVERAIKSFENTNMKKLVLISQTTYSVKRFEVVKQLIINNIDSNINFEIKNTICLATEARQKETRELSQNVDIMIIIGGKNSSNTKKLYETALENCENTICIETKEDLRNIDINENTKIGIMAGASTPQKSIDEVVKTLEKMCQ